MTMRDRWLTCWFSGLIGLVLLAALASPQAGCSNCSLFVSTLSLPDGVVGTSYFFALDSHCGGDVWFIQDGSLPPGIGLQDDGELAGTPTLEGDYLFTVGVFDFGSGETAFKGLSIRVVRP